MPCCVTRPDGTFAPIYFKYFKGGFHGPNCLGMFLGRAKLEVSEAPSTKYTHISSDLPWRGRGWFTSARKEGISFSVMQKVGNTLLLLPVFIYSLCRKEEKRTLKKKKFYFSLMSSLVECYHLIQFFYKASFYRTCNAREWKREPANPPTSPRRFTMECIHTCCHSADCRAQQMY